ncbi:hypothetical protein OEA41_005979 [Lepraria neglecta]|uniref:ditrans,polycis-polyprenyl diphosphate synthase [(2E,6E)-farnesyldiphosphate specific] n=1 Tax=Lepraria neglecta TaxID=209136 RepID=A0AAD9Z6V4_9LECA|nr:hypothetical protein OEA41_005979 [Lepraria neglecta]
MVLSKETNAYRQDVRAKGAFLTPQQREDLLKPYLPAPPPSMASKAPTTRKGMSQPVLSFASTQIHLFVFTIIHLLFSVYVRIRQTYHVLLNQVFAILYYHHRAPELVKQDVKNLSRLPKHLSVILELKGEERGTTGVESLMDELAELSAWCACVGIPMLSVYEKTVTSKLHAYFGRNIPSLQIRAPHIPSLLNGGSSEELDQLDSPSGHLLILLLSAEDGRSTLVDLTKTLTEMSQRKKLSPNDISLDLVDAEITGSVMDEPGLLVLFGPNVELQGYPPWQIRLTEIFHVQDNTDVGYQVFLRALHSFAKAQMRFGR